MLKICFFRGIAGFGGAGSSEDRIQQLRTRGCSGPRPCGTFALRVFLFAGSSELAPAIVAMVSYQFQRLLQALRMDLKQGRRIGAELKLDLSPLNPKPKNLTH